MAEVRRKETQHVKRHFRRVDPNIHAVMEKMGLKKLRAEKETDKYFLKLCADIISQQLGSRAADAIFNRFLGLFSGAPTPEKILEISEEKFRSIGMSYAKARYVRNLAQSVRNGEVDLKNLSKSSDEEVIAELTKIKGVGRWTAEMFLIFTLGREDVFSFGDLGLRKGLEKVYGKNRTHSLKSVERITGRWSPYRSYGSLALWRLLDSDK
ncbi:MAG: DNA-3-methyladenine glycosylase 2 family protein [Patescibacteria group bacterium]|nr:DNA-3-methyladenine glycosylase 2 family protein [Patescibacteria group bacterium]